MQTLKSSVSTELLIKKSRFLAWVEPIANVDEAKARIAYFKSQYPDARHVCSAFYVDGQTGLSDDGEPSGTAAKPMFQVMNHKRLVNVVAIVVRYFGGIKLGAGGLVRAYGGAVSEALGSAEFIPVESQIPWRVQADFSLESAIRRVLEPFSLSFDVRYEKQVIITGKVSESEQASLQAALLAVAPGNPTLDVQLEAPKRPQSG